MKKTSMLIIGILLAINLLIASCSTGNVVKEEVIKVGVITPMTGDVADIGISSLKAIGLAVNEFNAKGGKQIKLVMEDGQCDGTASTNAANKLINVDGVKIILGGLCSGETLAAAPIAETNKVVLFSPCSSAPKVTDAGDYVFRDYPSDAYQGVFAANYAFNEGKRKTAIIYSNTDWGIGVKDSFAKEFKRLGGEIVAEEAAQRESTDLKTQLTKVKAKDPDLLYTPFYAQNQGLVIKQVKELGMSIQILGADAAAGQVTLDIAGDAAEGFKYIAPKKTKNAEYLSKLSEHGIDNNLCTPTGYDAANIAFEIIDRVGNDAEAIKAELYKVKDYPGVTGLITIDENGDRIGAEYSVFEFQNGEYVAII